MVAKLVVAKGKTSVKEIPLAGEQTIIGRRNDCNLRIPSTMVSRQHCSLTLQGERLLVKDLGSSNGTFVNGAKIKQKLLKSGDTLGVGPVIFIVQLGGVPASPADTARPARAAAVAQTSDDAADFVVDEEPVEAVVEADFGVDDESAVAAVVEADFVVDEEPSEAAVVDLDFVVDEEPAVAVVVEADFVVDEEPAAAVVDADFVTDDEPAVEAVVEADFVAEEESAPASKADFVVADEATGGGELDFVVSDEVTEAAPADVDFIVADEAAPDGDTVHNVNIADLARSAQPADAAADDIASFVAEPADEPTPAAETQKKKGGLFGMFRKKAKCEKATDETARGATTKVETAKTAKTAARPSAPPPTPPPASKHTAKNSPPAAAPAATTPAPLAAPAAQSDEADFFVTDDASESKPAVGEDEMADFLMGLNEKED